MSTLKAPNLPPPLRCAAQALRGPGAYCGPAPKVPRGAKDAPAKDQSARGRAIKRARWALGDGAASEASDEERAEQRPRAPGVMRHPKPPKQPRLAAERPPLPLPAELQARLAALLEAALAPGEAGGAALDKPLGPPADNGRVKAPKAAQRAAAAAARAIGADVRAAAPAELERVLAVDARGITARLRGCQYAELEALQARARAHAALGMLS